MLELRGIKKDYPAGNGKVHALKGIDLSFRPAEFVSILGPSGCGKTTMLNIIGGLDGYTEGDLLIDGVSTKKYKDRDWDTYRNHSIGFVFQTYHLIPHQTVLSNVELALTLSGVKKAERRKRAIAALEAVGLGDQLKKKPGEMSGGQMQRVAIARALVNNPQIILADEPTGALDTETSVSVMDILKEISKDRLVIMVTHNPDLAETYSSRIIRMLDGKITSDSAPLTDAEQTALREREKPAPAKQKKPSMSFATSFSLSLKNLFTKKGRTLLTAFAGSIGIIGIALILALSTGINNYIEQVQRETLSSYPISIQAETLDMTAMMASMMSSRAEEGVEQEEGRIYSSTVMADMLDTMFNMETSTNNLKDFKTWLDNGGGGIKDMATVQYTYDLPFDVYTMDQEGVVVKSDIAALMEDAMNTMTGGSMAGMSQMNGMSAMSGTMEVWEELLLGDGDELVHDSVKEQYDVIYGHWPENYDEAVLFVSENNQISDLLLISLGLVPSRVLDETLQAIMTGGEFVPVGGNWSYEELCNMQFKLILPAETYRYDAATDGYVHLAATEEGMKLLYNSSAVGTKLKIVGIARPNEEATATMVRGAIGYTHALSEYAMEKTLQSDVVQAQLGDPTVDVFTKLPFMTGEEVEPTEEEIRTAVKAHLLSLSDSEKAAAYVALMATPADDYVKTTAQTQMAGMDRAAVEQMVVEEYSQKMGMDAETVRGYIAGMTDEELFSQVLAAMEDAIRQQYAQAVTQQMSVIPESQKAQILTALLTQEDAALAAMQLQPLQSWQYQHLYDTVLPPKYSESTLEENLEILGHADEASPDGVNIYALTFSDKDIIADKIAEYNAKVAEEDRIEYTDYVALLMSSITAIISGISYLLIAFVSISLVVSSIMIGVITLISVQERTKEIGILRAIGASKKDVSGLFNAETIIVGLCAGLVGIVTSVLLTIPINAILLHYTGLVGLRATLPVAGAVTLVIISTLLTLLAGIIPSRSAAKKDPVVALRTE